MNKVSTSYRREKFIGFLQVTFFFLLLTTFSCLLLFMYNTNYNAFSRKKSIQEVTGRNHKFQQDQNRVAPIVKDLHEKIRIYDYGVNAHYEKDNINYMIGQIKNVYSQNPWDTRYKAFLHIAEFYEMWYEDKKILWANQENCRKTAENLQNCELGLNNRRNDLNSRR